MSYLLRNSTRLLRKTTTTTKPLTTSITRTFHHTRNTMAPTLTPAQVAIVKSTAPALKEHGVDITALFYSNMLKAHPELNDIFSEVSQTTRRQPRALAASVVAYATYIDDLGKLGPAVERIAHKHVSLGVTAEQYAIVGKHLIEAVATVLGPAVTPEVADAWTAAYAQLADIFIAREGELYEGFAKDNWPGWRRFRIQRKVPESALITSFYLVPEDGKPLPLFKPGQYISLHMQIPELGHLQPRQYSLSEAPRSDYYRISVKRVGSSFFSYSSPASPLPPNSSLLT